MAFNQPQRRYFVVNEGKLLPSGNKTKDLAIGQVGIFNAKTWLSTTSPNYNTEKSIVIGYGTPDYVLPDGAAKGNETFKTLPIDGKKITGWTVKKAQRPQNRILAVGFDGVDNTLNLTLNKGEVKKFWIKLSGQPVANLKGKFSVPAPYAVHIEEFTIDGGCVADCTDDCGEAIAPSEVANKVISAINSRKIIGGQPLSKYVLAEKIVDCVTPSGLPTVETTKWVLTVADNGTQKDLGVVQAQYPGLTVTVKSRSGIFTTYEVTSDTEPSAFNSGALTAIPNCDVCPSGYTLVPEYNVFKIVRAGNVAASTIESAYTGTIVANSTVKLSFANGQSTFQVFATTDTLVAQSTDVVSFVGTEQGLCTQDNPVDVSWTESQTCTKVQGQFTLTVKLNDCKDIDGLTATLKAVYGEEVTLVEYDETFCTAKFSLPVLSDQDFCSDCGGDTVYTFTAPQAFEGIQWVKTVQNVVGEGCAAGVRLTSAYVARQRQECYFYAVDYETEPLFIEFSQHPFEYNNPKALCETDWAVKVVQEVKYPSGFGSFIADDEIYSRTYYNDFFKPDPAERAALNYQLQTNLQGFYDTYVISFENRELGTQYTVEDQENELYFYIAEGEGQAFETAINSYLSSFDSPVELETL